jgi:GDP-D-mannose 3',5'-epimerase
MKTALVLGAGGFIGNHMVDRLKSEGYWVRGVDLKYPEFSKSEADEMLIYDLRDPRNVEAVMRLNQFKKFSYSPAAFDTLVPFDEVYQFAADMGGAGYIFTGEHDADVMNNSALINLNTAAWAQIYGVKKLFYSSSACIYPGSIQEDVNNPGLKESDAYPASPDSDYGWEKLFSERLYLAYARNYGLNVRIARFHNVYGPEGVYLEPKSKAPAAMCRKVAEVSEVTRDCKTIEVWGDGLQTRSFLYISDCIDAVRLLMQSEHKEPVNIGSEEMISINDLALMTIEISGKNISIINNTASNAIGVRGRNSNNDLVTSVLNGWKPKVPLRDGMYKTYHWINDQLNNMNGYWQTMPGDMFDFESFYFKMAESLPNNCVIAEVGVADGKSALALAHFLRELGKEFTLYLIDSLDYGGKDQLNTIINHVISAGIDGVKIWAYDSLTAAERFPDGHFDFVFIDSSHEYNSTKKEIKAWYNKIKEGGILSGHDYSSHKEVNRAVNEVVPKIATRDPIPNPNYNPKDKSDNKFQQTFEPERVLYFEKTSLNFGIWFLKKKWYVKLNE